MSDPTTPPPVEPTPVGPPAGAAPSGPPVGVPSYVAPPPGGPAPVPPAKPSRGRRVLIVVASIVVAIGVFVLIRAVLTPGAPSKQEVIDKSVAQIKSQNILPKKVDSITSWTDVTAEPGAIRYVYTIDSSIDPSQVSSAKLKDAIGPTLCTTASTRKILDADITMKYHYTFPGSSSIIDLSFTKADC